jgi:membrane fusion protein (multidrug efflux system)
MPKRPFILKILVFSLVAVLLACAGLYWYFSDRLIFRATVTEGVREIFAGQGGTVSSLEVSEGQAIRKGQTLIVLEPPAPEGLEEELNHLRELVRALPPDHVLVPSPTGGQESLTQRLERRRLDEQIAEKRVQAAAEDLAGASIAYNRAVALAAKGALDPAQRDLADKDREEAEKAVREARQQFERLSRARAATDAEIRRLRQAQAASGADRVPVRERLMAYEEKNERIARLYGDRQNETLVAPFDGIVIRVLARKGQYLPPGALCLEARPAGAPVLLMALLPGEIAEELTPGLPCVVELAGDKNKYRGYVFSLEPAVDGAGMTASVALEDSALRVPPGSRAVVSALLNEPLVLLPSRPEGHPEQSEHP